MCGQIWLADLVYALAALRPASGEQRALIAQMLGLGPGPPSVVNSELADADLEDRSTSRTPFGTRMDDRTAIPATGVDPSDLPILKPIRQDRITAIGWSGEPLPADTEQAKATPPAHQTLLPPRTAAAILTAAAAKQVPEGPFDLPAVVDALARCHPIEQLPREHVATLRFGVQVLVDIGESMQLFKQDQQKVLAQIRTIVGAERTDVMHFADSPLRGTGPGAGPTWRPYQPPPLGTRILVLSHLGMVGPPLNPRRSRPAEWRVLIRLVQRSG